MPQTAWAQSAPGQPAASAIPVTINFDNLATGTPVTTQYPQVTFSAMGFSAGNGGPYGSTVYTATHNNSSGVSYPKGIVSLYNACTPGSECAQQDVYLEFPIPVNNFSFSILNSVVGYRPDYPICQVDIYVNRVLYGTHTVYGNGQPTVPIYVTGIKSIANVTNIRIRNVANTDSIGYVRKVYYDDFTFTPNLNINLTNYKIKNSEQALIILNGTTQNALLAGEVILDTTITPSNFTGGTYSWNVTGTHTVTGGTNQPSIHIRWKETGTYTATVTYTRGGFTTTGAISVKVIVPTLNSFTAQADPEQVNKGQKCSGLGALGDSLVSFTLGCWQDNNNALGGIVFKAQAQIPTLTYLTEPGEAGIKIKQYIYEFRKRVSDLDNGNIQCVAHRNSQGEVALAWQADGGEEISLFLGYPPRFYQGNTISRTSLDGPGSVLENRASTGELTQMIDASYADEYYETYVDYFVGSDHDHPLFTQPLKLSTEQTFRYSKIVWRRYAQAVFDPSVPNVRYRLQFSYSTLGTIQATGTNSLPPFQGNGPVQGNPFGPCPGDPAPSTNKLDGARCFIKWQYSDLFNRSPDSGGWDFWTYQITKCAFDRNCIFTQRYLVAREFFLSAEFIRTDPAMANPPGTPNFNPAIYNPAFVKHCYNGFLRRTGEQSGIDFWVDILNRTGDYNGVINAFITSDEYRVRMFDCQVLY